jgi:hypothetical protein
MQELQVSRELAIERRQLLTESGPEYTMGACAPCRSISR